VLVVNPLIHELDDQGLPPADLEARLAKHFHGAASPLQSQVLRALMGHPKRFQELVEDLRVGLDNNLTAALRVLRQEGVVAQRIDSSTRPPTPVYELTTLGADVLLLMERLRFTLEVSDAAETA
jgi:DNA-binding HxlR family transcriptional regulator